MRLLRAAWTIARRDYGATVFSRSFVLFLVGPLLPLIFGVSFGAIASQDDGPATPPPIALRTAPDASAILLATRERLATRLGDGWLPPLRPVMRPVAPGTLIIAGDLAHPLLVGPPDALERWAGPVQVLVDQARRPPQAEVPLRLHPVRFPALHGDDGRRDLARGAQLGLFVLTAILAGMLISNLVEEKSSKVIEVLAAAVPVDAVFLGKLTGMLLVSLTGIAAWGAAAAIGLAAAASHVTLPAPAVGWPAFVALAVGYFASIYLLMGAVYLAIGAQAGSVREVQILSMPLTMAQLLVFALASAAVAHPHGGLALAAVLLPWSSPFAMLARAAEEPALWPHLAAFAWQLMWLAVVVTAGARLFRRTVLGGGRLRWWRRRRLQR